MTVELLEALATDLLENEDLVGLCIVIEYGSLNNGTFYIRSSDLDSFSVCDEEHFAELYFSTFGIGKPLHKDLIASFHFKLLACNVYDCVHQTNSLKVWAVSVCAMAALNGLIGHKTDRKDNNYSLISK